MLSGSTFIEDVFEKFFKDKDVSSKSLQDYLDISRHVPQITIPISSPIYRLFQETVNEIEGDIAQYQIDYPGLYRVLNSVKSMLSTLGQNIKGNAASEDIWKSVLIRAR